MGRRGGARSNAGRKPKGKRAGVPHAERERFAVLRPVHVTMRMARHVFNLRSRRSFSVIARALAKSAQRFGMRIVQFAVLGNHMHLVVEAESHAALTRGMQGFSIRVAKKLNAMMNKRGRVVGDRFHSRVLHTRSQVRRVVAYVRNNYRKHMSQIGQTILATYIDRFSSDAGTIALPKPISLLFTPYQARAP